MTLGYSTKLPGPLSGVPGRTKVGRGEDEESRDSTQNQNMKKKVKGTEKEDCALRDRYRRRRVTGSTGNR